MSASNNDGNVTSADNIQVMPPNSRDKRALANYQFSPEEARVLQECNTESFFKRSLPFGSVLGIGTLYAVKTGYFRASPRFGAIPKVAGAVIFGYLVGKLSYQQKCAEKLMRLPDSYIGQLLREKRGSSGAVPGIGSGISMFGATAPDVYSDAGPKSSLDLDTDRPTFSGLDDSFRPNNDDLTIDSNSLPKHPGLSYDDLRKKHRDEQNSSRSQPYKLEEIPPPVLRTRIQQEPKNKYGDVVD